MFVAKQRVPFETQEPADTPVRPDDEPAGQRLLELQQRTAYSAELRPLLRGPIVRLGIVERIGEPPVVVVRQVRLPVALIRQPQRQRYDRQQAVEGVGAGRVAMYDFVLQ